MGYVGNLFYAVVASFLFMLLGLLFPFHAKGGEAQKSPPALGSEADGWFALYRDPEDRGWIRLSNAPCPEAAIEALVPPEMRVNQWRYGHEFRRNDAKLFPLCWAVLQKHTAPFDGPVVWVEYFKGDDGWVPLELFTIHRVPVQGKEM